MRSKRVRSALAALAVLGLMAGCSTNGTESEGPSEPAGSEPQKVTMWLYPVIGDEATHKGIWDKTIADFEDQNENITVEYEVFPWANRDEALKTAIAADVGPDLVYLIPDQLAAYEKSIEPLNDYLSEDQQSDLLDNVKGSVTFDGNLMGAPILTSALPLTCNVKVFEAAGVTDYPTTWDDFLEMAPKFVDAGLYALSYPAFPEESLNNTFYPLLWQAGGKIFNDDGTIGFASEEGVAALKFLTDLNDMKALDPELITTNVPPEQSALAQDKAACTWNSPIPQLLELWGPENVKVLPPLTNKESVTYGTVGSLSMLKSAKDKEAAGKFAEFATSKDQVEPYLKESGYFSALNSISGLFADDPVLSEVEKIVPLTTVGEINVSGREVMGVLVPEIQAALIGQKTAEQAMADAAAAAEPIVNN